MSNLPERSPKGHGGKEPKKKRRSPAQALKEVFSPLKIKKPVSSESSEKSARKSLFQYSGAAAAAATSTSETLDVRYLDSKYAGNIAHTLKSLDLTRENEYPEVIRTGEQSFGFNSAPLTFDRYFSPRKSPIKVKSNVKTKKIEKSSPKAQSSSSDEYKTDNPSKVYMKHLVNFSPSQMSINASLKIRDRPSEEPLKFDDADRKDELFPNKPFPEEEKRLFLEGNLAVNPDFIREFISPLEEETRHYGASKDYEPDREVIERMRKPVLHEYEDDLVLKRGDVHIKRGVLSELTQIKLVLLSTGHLLFYENSCSFHETAAFVYHFKDCKMEDKYPIYFVNVTARDSVSDVQLRLGFRERNTRDEWGECLKYLEENLLNSNSDDTFDEFEAKNELERFCNTYPSCESIEDYELQSVLGRGAYGKILYCKHKVTKNHCAMKAMRRDRTLQEKGVDSVIFQNHLLRQYHPFLQKLDYTFANEYLVIFVMDFANGGNLHDYVYKDRKFSEKIAVYYGAQMVSAILYLHKKGVIFRDLCLSNSHLDYKGNLKLTDYGFSVGDIDKMCFNLHILQDMTYVAPELLCGEPYAFSCDWWSFGVCFYSMLTGDKLFYANTNTEVAHKILNDRFNCNFPKTTIRDFVSRLLEYEPRNRLGCNTNNEMDILDHPIFKEFLWKKWKDFEIKPPIRPKVRTADDYSLYQEQPSKYNRIVLSPPKPTRKPYYIYENGKLKDIFTD